MTHETVPLNRRIYMVMQTAAGGMMQIRLSAMPPHYDEPAAVLLVRGVLPMADDVVLQIVSDPAANPSLRGKDGAPASAILGKVTISQTATVAISAGTRRLTVPIPAAWGVSAGDPLIALPSVAIAGYAVHDVVALTATSLSIGLTAPLLAIGGSFAIPCRIARLNT